MAGLVFAFAGILGGQLLNIPELDGVAAICIGVILTIVAALLAYEAKGLLIGESATPSVVQGVIPTGFIQNPWAHFRRPIDMIFQG